MKCLFVVPHYGLNDKLQMYDFPLGLAYVAAAAREAGHDTFGINLNHPDKTPEEAFEGIDVLTGGLCTHYQETKKLVDMVREGWPHIKVVVGGGLFSGTPDLMHEMLKPDVGVIGEGEACIAEVLNDLENGRAAKTYTSAPIRNLDSITPPDYELFNIRDYLSNQHPNGHYYTCPQDYPRSLAVIASRGCPFDCSFCYHPLGKGYRQRSPQSFLSEVEDLIAKYDLNILCIVDEVLGWKRERLVELLDGLKRLKIQWMCQMRVDQVDKDIIAEMKAAGCYYISYGIESADNRVLKAMKKHITVEQIDKALDLTFKANMGIQGNILFGDPSETDSSLMRSFTWWFKNRKYTLNAIRLVPYPDSPIWRRMVSSGKINPKKFIEDGCPSGHMSISEVSGVTKDFEDLFRDHLYDCYILSMPMVPCETAIMEDFPEERLGTYIAKAMCPWCHKPVRYENYILGAAPFIRMICRECYQGFLIHVHKEFARHGSDLRSGSKAYDEARKREEETVDESFLQREFVPDPTNPRKRPPFL